MLQLHTTLIYRYSYEEYARVLHGDAQSIIRTSADTVPASNTDTFAMKTIQSITILNINNTFAMKIFVYNRAQY